MPLSLKLRQHTQLPLEVRGLTPDALRGLSLPEIEQRPIQYGNRKAPLAEWFAVSGSTDDDQVEWHGDLCGVHGIAAGQRAGATRVVGNAGRHAGAAMRGGELTIEGNASDWLGAELHGGIIRVAGDAGNCVGAAYRGSSRGMTRGAILVAGSAGDEIGHSQRRGLIAIGHDAGDLVGFHMLAGTIIVRGRSGEHPGAAMKRGTLALLGGHRGQLLPSFAHGCRYEGVALRLVARSLQSLGFSAPVEQLEQPLEMFHGDLLEGGRGELFLPN